MTAAVQGQLDLFDATDSCPSCGHESDIHYPPTAGTSGCRVFTCGCPGWVSDQMRDQAEQERAEWAARFKRADWVAPYDTSGGMKAGESKSGWACPGCGQIEPNEFLLSLNHGYAPDIPGQWPGRWAAQEFGDICSRQILLASQERARAARGDAA